MFNFNMRAYWWHEVRSIGHLLVKGSPKFELNAWKLYHIFPPICKRLQTLFKDQLDRSNATCSFNDFPRFHISALNIIIALPKWLEGMKVLVVTSSFRSMKMTHRYTRSHFGLWCNFILIWATEQGDSYCRITSKKLKLASRLTVSLGNI